MANENNAVTINVSLSGGGITRPGFGTAMILSNTGNAWATAERTRDYASLAALAVDFPSPAPEYLAANALFGQEIKPERVTVGKGTNKPTQVKTIAISQVANSTLYKVNAYNAGRLWNAKYTSDGSATNDEIVAGLVAQLTPPAWVTLTAYGVGDRVTHDTGKAYECTIAGTTGATGPLGTGTQALDGTVQWVYIATPNFTATATGAGGSHVATCTGNAAGSWFAIEPIASYDPEAVSDLMALTDTTADPGIAADLAAILSANSSWYAIALIFKSAALVATASTGAAAWAAANKRLLLASMSDTASATAAYSGATDALHTLTAANYDYVAGMWHPRDYEWFDAAKLGYFLPLDPGTDNWCFKSYAGVTPCNVNDTQQTNLNARRAAFYYTIGANLEVDGGLGQVENTNIGFIDTRRDLDDYGINLQDDLIDLRYREKKIAHTDAGLRKIATAIKARNAIAIEAGIISPDVDPVVTVPRASDVGTYDPTTRQQTGISTSWQLANAIDGITVNVLVAQ